MKAKEARRIAKEREKFGLLIDAIEKEAKKGNVELEVGSIDIGEAYYVLSDEERQWLRDNDYFVYEVDWDTDCMPDKEIINWA